MNRWLLAVLALTPVVLAFLIGWTAPGRPEEPLAVSRGTRSSIGLTLRPGESTGAAVRFLRALRSDPPPPMPEPVPVPPPPPPPPPPLPPPDISVTFKSALSAIERDPSTGGFRVLIRYPASSLTQVRALSLGEIFQDGWRIEAVTASTVTLANGDDTRVVQLFS